MSTEEDKHKDQDEEIPRVITDLVGPGRAKRFHAIPAKVDGAGGASGGERAPREK